MDFILLIIGLAIIIKSADLLIDSTSQIASRYGVSTFVIGITVIAFGTSAPELVVGLVSGFRATNGLTLGNIIGSSFANTALIIGITALILPLSVKDRVVKREIPMLIVVQTVLALMLIIDGQLSRLDGLILILAFTAFISYIIVNMKRSVPVTYDQEADMDTDGDGNQLSEKQLQLMDRSLPRLYLTTVVALLGLFLAGQLVVDQSTAIANRLGLSETLIGLTVVSIATTLPEMITSIVAVKKNEPDIVIGNCVGSNLFNILLVLGLSSLIHPIDVQGDISFELLLMMLLTMILFTVSLVKKNLSRRFGFFMLLSYVSYIAFKIVTVLV